MKYLNWNEEKNKKLKEKRNISFEEIALCIQNRLIEKIIEHPNKKRYSNQKMYVISYNNYTYLVPFVEGEKEIFLKTIIPSRKAKRALNKGDENG